MGCLRTQSGRSDLRVRAGLRLALFALVGGLVAGCSSGIDGAPECADKRLVVTGSSAERQVDIDVPFTGGGLTQTKDAGGAMNLTLSQGTFGLTWDTTLENDSATVVTGSVSGIPGGPLCFGGQSEIEISSDKTTFHLESLHQCDASSIVPGELFGCAGLSGSAK